MRRVGIALGILVLMLAVGGVSWVGKTCAICRLDRADCLYWVVPYTSYAPNECSDWFDAHVDPDHEHAWEWTTCRRTVGLLYSSYGCRPGLDPIGRLESFEQLDFYKHLKDPREGVALFRNLADDEWCRPRDEGFLEDRGRTTVRAIRDWRFAGFPGTWDEWQAGFRARQAAELERERQAEAAPTVDNLPGRVD